MNRLLLWLMVSCCCGGGRLVSRFLVGWVWFGVRFVCCCVLFVLNILRLC